MPETLQLTVRQGEILRRVVEEFVATGAPVGSKTLVERAHLRVSPSTVRAELSELDRLCSRGLIDVAGSRGRNRFIRLTARGRPLGGGVTAAVLA